MKKSDCVFLGILIGGILSILINDLQYPSAMDVYRGKTTLKITYIDGVAIDSVVVFRE